MAQNKFQIESLLKIRTRKGKEEVFVRWAGFGSKHDSWEPIEGDIAECCLVELEALRQEAIDRTQALRLNRLLNGKKRVSFKIDKPGSEKKSHAQPSLQLSDMPIKLPKQELNCLLPRMRFKKGAKKKAEASILRRQTCSSMRRAWTEMVKSDRNGNPAHVPRFLLMRAMKGV